MKSANKDDAETASAAFLANELRGTIGKLKRRLRAQGPVDDLTWPQLLTLTRLESNGPVTVSALAQAEGMRSQSMGAIVAALQAAGHVQGTPDPLDKRQTLLTLTDSCREWIKAGRAARQDWLSRAIRTHLEPGEQRQLASALELLKRLADS